MGSVRGHPPDPGPTGGSIQPSRSARGRWASDFAPTTCLGFLEAPLRDAKCPPLVLIPQFASGFT